MLAWYKHKDKHIFYKTDEKIEKSIQGWKNIAGDRGTRFFL
jgi:hypothetical protein